MLQLVALIGKLEDKVGCCWWRVWALSDALAAIWCHCDGATEQGPVSLDADDAGPLNSLNNLHCCKVAKQLQILALDIFYCKVLSFRVTWYHCKVHVYLFWPLKHRLTLPGILHPVISKQPLTATAFKFDVVFFINATCILHLQIWAKPLCSLEVIWNKQLQTLRLQYFAISLLACSWQGHALRYCATVWATYLLSEWNCCSTSGRHTH